MLLLTRHFGWQGLRGIWDFQGHPLVIDDQDVIVRPSMVHAQYVAPTMLVLALHVKHARIDVCAAHAPTSKATRLQRQHWWDKLEAALADARDPSVPLYLLIDANARLGSECSEAIGAHHAQREDYAGQRLRVIADRCRFAPASNLGRPHGPRSFPHLVV